MKISEGEVPQYCIEQSHQSIIGPEKFDRVQAIDIYSICRYNDANLWRGGGR